MYKVMIVDDEPIIVEGLSRSIAWEKWNCKVAATAHDGLEGKKIIEEIHPDIVFMDICMPEMDGLEASRAIRDIDPEIPIIALTANAFDSDKQKAIDAGCNDYMAKPIVVGQLTAMIKKYI